MVALAQVAQLRTRLQDDTLDAVVAQQAIDDGAALVRAVAGQDFDFTANDTVVLRGGGREVTLPQRPVVVDAGHPLTVVELPDVGAAGVAVTDGVHYRRVGDRLVKAARTRLSPWAFAGPGAAELAEVWDWQPTPAGVWAPWVQVTYSHGYQSDSEVPDYLTALVLDAAASYASNPQGLRSVALDGEVTLTYSGESVTASRSLVDDLRRRLRGVRVLRGGAFTIPT